MSRPALLLPIALLSLACQLAMAQETDSELYDGKWSARWQTANGATQSARVVIADFAGTWQDVPAKGRAADKACSGKKFPITVQRSRPSEMQFMVWGSSVAATCPDLALDLKPTDAKTLEGTIGDGMKVKLTRQ
jgi:hypothetical protein